MVMRIQVQGDSNGRELDYKHMAVMAFRLIQKLHDFDELEADEIHSFNVSFNNDIDRAYIKLRTDILGNVEYDIDYEFLTSIGIELINYEAIQRDLSLVLQRKTKLGGIDIKNTNSCNSTCDTCECDDSSKSTKSQITSDNSNISYPLEDTDSPENKKIDVEELADNILDIVAATIMGLADIIGEGFSLDSDFDSDEDEELVISSNIDSMIDSIYEDAYEEGFLAGIAHEKESKKREICIICNKDTGEFVSTPLEERNLYIEGIGQLCQFCYDNAMKHKN